MRKFLLLLVGLFSITLSAQSYTCDDLLSDIKDYGTKEDYELIFSSSAISDMEWWSYDDTYFALIQFNNGYGSKVYVYGNWSQYDYESVKWDFEMELLTNGGSYGKAFHAVIRPNSRVGCETSDIWL